MNNLVGWTITEALEVTYSHHHYSVGGVLHRQLDWGLPGLDTSVEVSDVYEGGLPTH